MRANRTSWAGTSLWHNPDGIANIMFMNNVAKHYRLTLNTNEEKCIYVHNEDGTTMKFSPSRTRELYKYKLQPGETIKNVWCMVANVDRQKGLYTDREIKQDKRFRKIKNIIMRPGDRKLMDVTIKNLRGCQITCYDIQIAEDIYGTNIGSLKLKLVRRPNTHMLSGVDPVSEAMLERN